MNRRFHHDLDGWFNKVRETHAAEMQCGKGCTACCYGLFDFWKSLL